MSDLFRPPVPAPSQLLMSNFALPVPRIVSYNVNSLSYYSTASDLVLRRGLITSCLRDLASSTDILCLQETNLAATESFALSSISPQGSVSLNNHKMFQAGTAIIDSPTILQYYTAIDVPLPAGSKDMPNSEDTSPGAPHTRHSSYSTYTLRPVLTKLVPRLTWSA